jgi:hypothetical protein
MIKCCRRSFSPLLFVAIGLTASGCSGSGDDLPREAVSGTVTLDDQPLAAGTISFTPSDKSGGNSGSGAIKDGKFSIARAEGLVPGSYVVAIYSSAKEVEQTKPASPGKLDRKALPKESIPSKYNSASELKADIPKGGTSSLNYPLVTK